MHVSHVVVPLLIFLLQNVLDGIDALNTAILSPNAMKAVDIVNISAYCMEARSIVAFLLMRSFPCWCFCVLVVFGCGTDAADISADLFCLLLDVRYCHTEGWLSPRLTFPRSGVDVVDILQMWRLLLEMFLQACCWCCYSIDFCRLTVNGTSAMRNCFACWRSSVDVSGCLFRCL